MIGPRGLARSCRAAYSVKDRIEQRPEGSAAVLRLPQIKIVWLQLVHAGARHWPETRSGRSGMKNCTHHGLSDVSRVEQEAWVARWSLSITVEILVAIMLSIRVHGVMLKPRRGKARLLEAPTQGSCDIFVQNLCAETSQ